MKAAIALLAIVVGAVFLLQEQAFRHEDGRILHEAKGEYRPTSVDAPRTVGFALEAISRVINSHILGGPLITMMHKQNNLDLFRKYVEEFAAGLPNKYIPQLYPKSTDYNGAWIELHEKHAKDFSIDTFQFPEMSTTGDFRYATIKDYTDHYQAGTLTPTDVARAVLDVINRTNNEMRAFIEVNAELVLQEAQKSSERWERGSPLGLLDGVPIAVKDEVDVVGYHSTMGTSFLANLSDGPSTKSCVAVERLQNAGAIVVGKLNMQEIGIGTTGSNVNHGTPQNPHNPKHYPGGSSSGSAVAVAAGIVPLAVGADGGGSIRIPSALTGIFGLKPTFARVPHPPGFVWSVGHLGPMAGSTQDLSLGYALMAGAAPEEDPLGAHQPSVHLAALRSLDPGTQRPLQGKRIGVFWPYLEDADAEVVAACKQALDRLQKAGAELVSISLPALEVLQKAHLATIASEMAVWADPYLSEHLQAFTPETRINLAIARGYSGRAVLDAQRIRSFATGVLEELFSSQVDLIATPATATTAPEAMEDTVAYGESNLQQTTKLMRYAPAGNFVGIPGIVFPVGYDKQGLPIGMQLMADFFREDLLLAVAHTAMNDLPGGMRRPQVYVDILEEAKKIHEQTASK